MKQETILKGHDLLYNIEAVQKTKAALGITTQVDLSCSQSGTMITLKPTDEARHISVRNTNPPIELREAINEESIRFLQRCKRHCDDLEFKLKQELEDLA